VTTIAVVGLGAMGSRIARRFLDAGNELVVWNRDAAKTRPLIEAGAARAESPAEAARDADVVVTMVSDPQALQAVTEGSDGIAAGVSTDTTVIQMSTVGLEPVARLASALPDGADLLDAPVLGSVSEAEAGTLKVFVGGPEPLVERWTPLLSTLGDVLHVGDVGAGSAAKLVANATLIGTIGLLGESLALADAVGLPRAAAFDVLATTSLAAQAERRRAAIESGNYPPRFALSLARKDADLILAASTADVRILRAARTWLADAEASGLGADDYSAVLTTILGKE
jgi:3-hydroxyisobutyrate dehydrogenase-like beta-hydroxyacid dehydrogenase